MTGCLLCKINVLVLNKFCALYSCNFTKRISYLKHVCVVLRFVRFDWLINR